MEKDLDILNYNLWIIVEVKETLYIYIFSLFLFFSLFLVGFGKAHLQRCF